MDEVKLEGYATLAATMTGMAHGLAFDSKDTF